MAWSRFRPAAARLSLQSLRLRTRYRRARRWPFTWCRTWLLEIKWSIPLSPIFRHQFGSTGLFGGFKADAKLDPIVRREILVVTPERLDALLRSRDLYQYCKIVVFDEAHVLENGSRGARIEALIARFRLKQIAGGQFRIILLSAVLNDVDALCRWLGTQL